MKRKTSGLPTRIWSFAARAPVANESVVRDILFRQSRYYNALIEIERDRIQRYQEVRRTFAPALEPLEAATNQLDAECERLAALAKAERAKVFTATGAKSRAMDSGLKKQLETTRAEFKETRSRLSEARRLFEALLAPARDEHKRRRDAEGAGVGPVTKSKVNASVLAAMLSEPEWPAAWKALAQCDDEAHDRAIAARAACELPPGCYLLVEAAAQKAIADSRPAPPRFRRFTGEGRVGVQLKTLTVAEAMTGHGTMMRLELRHDRAGKSGVYGDALIRVGTNPDRSPLFATFPVRLHRPLPHDATLKWAWVKVSRVGLALRYELQLTLEAESFSEPVARGDGRVAVNFGWCQKAHGLQTATWLGDDGRSGVVTVNEELRRRLERAHVLRGHADLHRDYAYRVLRRWLHLAGNRIELRLGKFGSCNSDRRREQLKSHARAWAEYVLSEQRMPLWEAWKKHRRDQYLDLFAPLGEVTRWLGRELAPEKRMAFFVEIWTRKDSHLRKLEAHAAQSSVNARDEYFREAALALRRSYSALIDDDSKLTELAKVPDVDNPAEAQARHQRQHAAPGRCREILREVFGKTHERRVDGKHATETCSACGTKLAIVNRFGTCPGCGLVIDIDVNNCANLLQRDDRERFGGDENPGGARGSEIQREISARGTGGKPLQALNNASASG